MLSQKTNWNNYIIFDNPYILSKKILYIDTTNFLADSIFIQHNIRIKLKQHYESNKYPSYVAIIANVRISDIDSFKDSMEQLKKKQLIYGNNEYTEICSKIMEELLNEKTSITRN